MRGLTLTELIIAVTISGILMFSIGMFMVNIVRAEKETMSIHNLMSSTDIATEIFREYTTQAQGIELLSPSAMRIYIENDSGVEEPYEFYYHHDGQVGHLLYTKPAWASPNSLVSGVQNVTFIPTGVGPYGPHTVRMIMEVEVSGQIVTRATTVTALNVQRE